MHATSSSRILSTIATVAALSLGAAACGSDGSADDISSIPDTIGTEPTDGSTASTDSGETTEVSFDSENTGGLTSDDLQDYIDSLVATTDNFDGLTTTPDERTCAATAILTPIGVEVLQRENVSVENVDNELDLVELGSPEAAAGIADGLVSCGLGPRFAASLAQGETGEDLDEAQQSELLDCVQPKLDDETARSLLTGFLTPPTDGRTQSQERSDAGLKLAGMVRDCGFDPRPYP